MAGAFRSRARVSRRRQFAQADSEFERCLKRRGEALQLILGDEPTYAYLPPVYYYQGLVREGMKVEGAADSYREYLKFRGNSTDDPHLPGHSQARRQLASDSHGRDVSVAA